MEMFQEMGLDALICIGGDGTLGISHEFYKKGIPLVGVPEDDRQRHLRHDELFRLRHRRSASPPTRSIACTRPPKPIAASSSSR